MILCSARLEVKVDQAKEALEELIAEIDYSPRYARRRERPWRRAAHKMLRTWAQTPA